MDPSRTQQCVFPRFFSFLYSGWLPRQLTVAESFDAMEHTFLRERTEILSDLVYLYRRKIGLAVLPAATRFHCKWFHFSSFAHAFPVERIPRINRSFFLERPCASTSSRSSKQWLWLRPLTFVHPIRISETRFFRTNTWYDGFIFQINCTVAMTLAYAIIWKVRSELKEYQTAWIFWRYVHMCNVFVTSDDSTSVWICHGTASRYIWIAWLVSDSILY